MTGITEEVREIEPIAVPVPSPVQLPEAQPAAPDPVEGPQKVGSARVAPVSLAVVGRLVAKAERAGVVRL